MNVIKLDNSVASGLSGRGQVGPETSVTTVDSAEQTSLEPSGKVTNESSASAVPSKATKETKASKKGAVSAPVSEDGTEKETKTQEKKPKDRDKDRDRDKEKKMEADKARELLEIRICSIQVSELIHAHRFKKNLPWLKVDYGEHHWEHPYIQDTQGDFADYLDLGWTFILQRDTRHRDDLIVTVCSDLGQGAVIIGRYMLGAAEFSNMPVTKTGFFKVTGKIVNALGIAGKVTIVFKKHIALPPKAPRFTEATPYSIQANTLPHDSRSYIRVVSIACADLKSAKMFEANSPHVVMTCHDWKKTTDVIVDSGLAAKWNRLPWKLVMDKFYPLLVEVNSERNLLGMVQFTLDELRSADTDVHGFKEIIRQLTDGSTFSGRIRIMLFMQDMPAKADQNTYHVDLPGLPHDQEDDFDQQDLRSARDDIYAKVKKPAHSGLALSSNLIKGSISCSPFVMRVMEAGVFDTKKCDRMKPNSLSLSAACGSWGGSTFQVKNCGSDAYWVGLSSTWRFIVEDNAVLHLNVWSRESFVGTVDMTAKNIMGYPIDPDGGTEIMLVLKDEGKSTGRLRLNCVFEYYRKGENTNYDPQPEPVVYIPPRAKKMVLDQYGDVPKYDLPCVAKIISISLVDLKSVHTFSKNSPRAKVVCDRKSAITSVMKMAGKSARWIDLDWDIPINEGCILMIYCLSGSVQIGFVELEAHHITAEPLDNYGMTSISQFIRDHDGMSTGKLTIIMQLQNVPDLNVYDAIVNGVDRDPYNLTKPLKSHVVDEEADPVLELMATQPFFALADAMATGVGIMLRVEIIELDVTDLDAVHFFGIKNSPMVSAACGRWADTTRAQKEAGDACYWTGLTWNFLMDDNLSVQFVVGSGKKVIGSVKCTAKQFAVARADQRGVKRVTLSMFKEVRGHHNFAGRLKVTYKLGVVRESEYIKRPHALERLHVEELNIPFNAAIKRIVARGMPRVHSIAPNEPRCRISYDDWSKPTSVSSSGSSEEAGWQESDLPAPEWVVSVCDDSMLFTMSIISASELIGIAEIKAIDIMNIPRNVKGIAEVVVTILKDGKSMGRVQIFMQLTNDKQAGPPHNQEEEDAELERIAMEEDKARERQQYWQAKQMLLGEDTIKMQQAEIRPIIVQHNAEKEVRDATVDLRMKAEREIHRTRLQAEMEGKAAREMMVQHKVMVAGAFTHKFAPLGDNPGGYVRLPAGQKQSQSPLGGSSQLPQEQGYAQKAQVLPASYLKMRGLQGGAALEGSDDEEYSEGYDPNGVRAFVPDDGSIVDLKQYNPPYLPANVLMAGDVSMLDMQDFNDDASVGAIPLHGQAKIVNIQKTHKFEGNGFEDDETSAISINSREKPRNTAPARANKVAAGDSELTVLDVDDPDSIAKLTAGNSNAKVKAKVRLASGLLTNKFDDHEVEQQRHITTNLLASAYSISITSMSVLDVPSVHLMKKNSLQAVCMCTGAAAGVDPTGLALAATDPVEYISDIMPSCGESANWTNLNWEFPLVYGKRRQYISIRFSSGKKAVSIYEIKADELYLDSLQEKPGAVVRKFADIHEGANFVGKIKLVYTTQLLSQ